MNSGWLEILIGPRLHKVKNGHTKENGNHQPEQMAFDHKSQFKIPSRIACESKEQREKRFKLVQVCEIENAPPNHHGEE